MEEIIGRSGLNAVLNLRRSQAGAKPVPVGPLGRMDYAEIAAIGSGLEQMYGPRGGHGVALRAGRAGFKYILRQNGLAMGITDLQFRLLPVPARVKTGLEAMAGLMARLGDEEVTISENEFSWFWSSRHCPYCWQRSNQQPVCHFTVGILQEFFSWVSSGRVYAVSELQCQACGAAACLFQIDKKAID